MRPGLTRRGAVLGLGPLRSCPRRARRSDYVIAAARKEGSLIWYVAQMSGEAAEDMGRIFTRQYPGVAVSVVRTTGQVAYQRCGRS